MPFFSVIIPLYNKSTYIQKTLNSVLNQEFLDYEIIVVNDGSTDNSLELVSAYVDSKITIINQDNQGVSVARNKGIEAAKGEFIAFLDADDIWKSNHLKEIYNAINYHPNKSIFCSNYEVVFSEKKINQTHFSVPIDSNYSVITDFFKSSLSSCIALTSAVTIKKEVLTTHNFDTSIKSGQDTDLWIRLALIYDFIFINEVTLTHLKSIQNSLSKSNLIDDRLYAIEKHKSSQLKNSSLHKYLDYNRFSIALQYKRVDEFKKANAVIKNIYKNNLTIKQRILLQLPSFIIPFLDSINKLF